MVLDYGSGNLRSVQRALERVGANVEITSDATSAASCDALVVPGVGAYASCMAGLTAVRGEPIIDEVPSWEEEVSGCRSRRRERALGRGDTHDP